MKGRYLFFLMLLIVLSIKNSEVVFGESLQKFDAQIQMNKYQVNRKNSYFDLLLQPNQEETLLIRLTNLQDSSVKIKPSFHRARTNKLGVIEYSGRNQDIVQGLPTDIQKILTIDTKELILGPKQEIIFPLQLKMPGRSFSGVIAGGVYFEEVPQSETTGNVKNIFSREIAVLVRNKESLMEPEINIVKAEATQENYRNAVKVHLQNTHAVYLSNGQVNYKLYFEDESDPILSSEKQISFAPNSGMDYLIPLDGQTFKTGNYRLALTISKGDNQWDGESRFTVTTNAADDYNESDVTVPEAQHNNLSLILIGVLIVLLIVIGILVWKLRRKNSLQK